MAEKRQLRTYPKSTTSQADYDRRRQSAAKRGYGRKWQKRRLAFLRLHPLCVDCQAEKKIEPAVEVDHIEPHRGDDAKFWDWSNLQGLCKTHHSKKTRRGE